MLYNKVQLDIYRAQLEARMLRRAQPQAQPGDNRYCSLVRNYCMCAPTYALQICTKPRSLHHALYSKLCSAGCYLYRGFHGMGKLVGLYDDLWRTLGVWPPPAWDEDLSSLQWSLMFFVKLSHWCRGDRAEYKHNYGRHEGVHTWCRGDRATVPHRTSYNLYTLQCH